jgi:hypothetical protein
LIFYWNWLILFSEIFFPVAAPALILFAVAAAAVTVVVVHLQREQVNWHKWFALTFEAKTVKTNFKVGNGIIDNGINRLNGIKFIQDYKSQITLSYPMHIEAHSLIMISPY